MAFSIPRNIEYLTPTVGAAADLTAHQFKAVRLTAGGVRLTAAVDVNSGPVFVLQNKPNSGDHCQLAATGQVTKAIAGAAVLIGTHVTINTSAQFITASFTNIGSEVVAGVAWAAAAAAGDVFAVLLT